jgi:hypothetical protein
MAKRVTNHDANQWYINEKITLDNNKTIYVVIPNEAEIYPKFEADGQIREYTNGIYRHLEQVELSERLTFPPNLQNKYQFDVRSEKLYDNTDYYFSFFSKILDQDEKSIYVYLTDGYVYVWNEAKQFKGAYIVLFNKMQKNTDEYHSAWKKYFCYKIINPTDSVDYQQRNAELSMLKNELDAAQRYYDQPIIRLEGAKAAYKVALDNSKQANETFITKWKNLIEQ